MTRNIIYIGFLLSLTLFSSCKKDFLDRQPMDAISDESFWTTEEQLQLALNALYAQETLKNSETVALDQMGDNSINSTTSDAYRLISAGVYGSDLSVLNTTWWADIYKGIRRCNVFLQNYQQATEVSEEIKNQMAGEAKTIRAYCYMQLTLLFGDVPLITEPLELDELYGPRTPREEVINFILAELDDAAGMMQAEPMTGSALGRFSKGVALALKARMALYDSRWTEAEQAAQAVMDLGVYHLYTTGNPEKDYYDLFTYTGKLANGTNHETIAARLNLVDVSRHNISRETQVPDQAARYNPTKALVDTYLCVDGLPIDRSPLYKEDTYEAIFENRDPRMKQTILAPGAAWGGKRDGNPNNTDPTIFTAPKFIADKLGCVTITGYYFTKYVELTTVPQVNRDANDIHLIRLAEVYLTYAEAKMEQGTLTQEDVDKTINLLRDRVGMKRMVLTELAQNGLDLRTEIRRERRVELAREGQRWFDMMRWKQGDLLALDTKGVKRDLVMDQNQVSNVAVDAQGYIVVLTGRRFEDPKNYLLPVPLVQTQRNPELGQNPGWN